MLVYACISCNHTYRHGKRCHVPETLSLGAAIGGPHPGHPWASENPLFFAHCKCCTDPIWRTPPRGTRPGPEKRPCHLPLGGLQCTIRALQSSPVAFHSRSGRLEPIQTPEGVGCHPSKTPPNHNSPMAVYVSICMYMYVHTVYVCICMYMYVYMTLPKSMIVYECICMYLCVYSYMHVYGHITVNMYVYACIWVYARIFL